MGLVSFVFTLWGTQNKRNLPTRPGSPTPCKQSLMLWCREGSLYFILTVSSLLNLTLLPPQSAVSLLQPSNGRPGERVCLQCIRTKLICVVNLKSSLENRELLEYMHFNKAQRTSISLATTLEKCLFRDLFTEHASTSTST